MDNGCVGAILVSCCVSIDSISNLSDMSPSVITSNSSQPLNTDKNV